MARGLRVLFVDDEKPLQEFMQSELPRLKHEVTVCPDGLTALKVLKKQSFDAAILDLRMPGMSGIEVLEQLKAACPTTEAVVMTGHASMETAIEAVRLGAFDYITKPCKLAQIDAVLRKIADKRAQESRNAPLQPQAGADDAPSILVGNSPAMTAVQRLLETIAPTDATALILGETGTGKELAARTLWKMSKRAHMPFVPINCGALSDNLVESELFGHEKDSFTNANKTHKGLFEVADGGTVFLDELGELNKSVQVKLLRFLESGEIRSVGSNEPRRLDVRVLCATNRDLREMVQSDEFREDLYFRVNTFEIPLPSLRDRRSDIPELARHLLARVAEKPVEQVGHLLTPEAIDALLEHHWAGNVRELANVMQYANILAGGGPIGPNHLPVNVTNHSAPRVTTPAHAGTSPLPSNAAPRTLKEMEMEHLLRVLDKHKGNKTAAAEELGISLKTIYNKLDKYNETRRAG